MAKNVGGVNAKCVNKLVKEGKIVFAETFYMNLFVSSALAKHKGEKGTQIFMWAKVLDRYMREVESIGRMQKGERKKAIWCNMLGKHTKGKLQTSTLK